MCQRQSQSVRRCYGHASAQLRRAQDALNQSFTLLSHPDQWGNRTQKQVYARHYRLMDRVDRARLTLAGTERGYLELLEQADQVMDGTHGRTNHNGTYTTAEWLRCIARAGQAGRSIEEQREAERQEHQEWLATKPRASITSFITEDGTEYAVTQRADHTGPVLRETADEYHTRIKRQRREARAAMKAERKTRADRLAELRGAASN